MSSSGHQIGAGGGSEVSFTLPINEEGNVEDYGPKIVGDLKSVVLPLPSSGETSNEKAEKHSLLINISQRKDIKADDLKLLEGIKGLNMSYCNQAGIADGLVHLHIVALDATDCPSISPLSLVPISSTLRTLNISWNNTLTNDFFPQFSNLTYLDISHCENDNLTDKAFENLKSIRTLKMSHCCSKFTAASLLSLPFAEKLIFLDIHHNTQFNDSSFSRLTGLVSLNISHCNQRSLTDKAFEHLNSLTRLDISYCNQTTLSSQRLFHKLGEHGHLTYLNITGCTQLSDKGFEHLTSVKELLMNNLKQSKITDKSVEGLLTSLKKLQINGVPQITKELRAKLKYNLEDEFQDEPDFLDAE